MKSSNNGLLLKKNKKQSCHCKGQFHSCTSGISNVSFRIQFPWVCNHWKSISKQTSICHWQQKCIYPVKEGCKHEWLVKTLFLTEEMYKIICCWSSGSTTVKKWNLHKMSPLTVIRGNFFFCSLVPLTVGGCNTTAIKTNLQMYSHTYEYKRKKNCHESWPWNNSWLIQWIAVSLLYGEIEHIRVYV